MSTNREIQGVDTWEESVKYYLAAITAEVLKLPSQPTRGRRLVGMMKVVVVVVEALRTIDC